MVPARQGRAGAADPSGFRAQGRGALAWVFLSGFENSMIEPGAFLCVPPLRDGKKRLTGAN